MASERDVKLLVTVSNLLDALVIRGVVTPVERQELSFIRRRVDAMRVKWDEYPHKPKEEGISVERLLACENVVEVSAKPVAARRDLISEVLRESGIE